MTRIISAEFLGHFSQRLRRSLLKWRPNSERQRTMLEFLKETCSSKAVFVNVGKQNRFQKET